MYTFNEKDLITWANRHTVKVGDKGYFAHRFSDLNENIEHGNICELIRISDDCAGCFIYDTYGYGFFLPVDAVKEDKRYRPFKDLYEFYKFLCPKSDFTREDFTQDMLWGLAFTYRKKDTQNFTVTELITRVEDGTVGGCNVICVNSRVLEYWFENMKL